jgi:hypothetical protein
LRSFLFCFCLKRHFPSASSSFDHIHTHAPQGNSQTRFHLTSTDASCVLDPRESQLSAMSAPKSPEVADPPAAPTTGKTPRTSFSKPVSLPRNALQAKAKLLETASASHNQSIDSVAATSPRRLLEQHPSALPTLSFADAVEDSPQFQEQITRASQHCTLLAEQLYRLSRYSLCRSSRFVELLGCVMCSVSLLL